MNRLLAALLLWPAVASAEPATFNIPGQGWQISFDAPAMTRLEENNHPKQYMYMGNAGRFNLSLYVEEPGCKGGDTHAAYYECFWPKAGRNPMIVKSSVKATNGERFYKVEYEVEAKHEGQTFRQRSLNYLIAYRGKWTDIHVSVISPDENDLRMLEAFEKSLTYGPSTDTAPAPGKVISEERNEADAQKYAYCGRVIGVALNQALESDDKVLGEALTTMRNHFIYAALFRSDAEFAKNAVIKAVEQFVEVRKSGKATFESELTRCAGVWKDEVRSIAAYITAKSVK